ncbi:MAG: YhfC family intramembrane metalloprotease [Ruminococcus sp.]|nr:YhfC family intramembrane metalloprotease [Ruminococcus sp.]
MEETVRIPGTAILALILESLPRLALPFVVFHFWRKKTGAPYKPALIGMAVFMVVIPVKNLLMKTIGPTDHPWIYYMMSASLAGIFEECGRYFAFSRLLGSYDDRKHCISYGIGHGSIECLVSGYLSLQELIVALWINGGGQDKSAEMLADSHPLISVFFFLSSAETLVFHIALSVIVFAAVHKLDGRKFLFAAIGAHAIIDMCAGLMYMGKLDSLELFLLDIPMTVVLVIAARAVYRDLYSYGEPWSAE